MKIESLLRKLALPKRYFNNDFVFADKYKEEANTFIFLLRQCDGEEFGFDKRAKIKTTLDELCIDAEQNVEIILNAVRFIEGADQKSAQEEFDALLCKLRNDVFISTIDDRVQISVKGAISYSTFRITPGYRYYRVRPVNDVSSNISQNADELFHIPHSKRAYANNERFSLAGFPSLYLSTMLPLAWQECGYPSKYYYSEYQYNRNADLSVRKCSADSELHFFSLYSPDEICNWGSTIKHNDFDLWLEVIARYLRTYPLVLACSFVNQSGKAPYKQEYIVPQMLMQWVQRNSTTVQGISYFTCVDTSMWTSNWCAYNIVIPAMPPYDSKGYSCILRKNFCWTYPRFFTVPIADVKNSTDDRAFLFSLLSDIRSAIRTYLFPMQFYNVFNKIINICGCLMSLLDSGDTQDMRLALHILNSISDNCNQLKNLNLESFFDNTKHDKHDLDIPSSDLETARNIFRDIFVRVVNNGAKTDCIESIIEKYRLQCWNNLCPHLQILLLYYDPLKIVEPLKWLGDNHILHNMHKLDSNDESVVYLKSIASDIKVPIDSFGEAPVESDEWMRENMHLIKEPVLIRQNDVSIISPCGTSSCELVQIGFDKNDLVNLLHL